MNDLLNHLAEHFNINPNEITFEKLLHGRREKQNVHKIRVKNEIYLLKRHEVVRAATDFGHTPFRIETHTLSMLNKGGCSVPQIVWLSEQQNAFLLSWCGDETLDTIAQKKSNTNRISTGWETQSAGWETQPLRQRILKELCKIENFFAENAAHFRPYLFQHNLEQNLRRLLEQGRSTLGYLQHLRKTAPTELQSAQLDAAWKSITGQLLDAKPTLGALDYQAHNIVIGNQQPHFIDFASIGWDWQERRLVQYFNSIGAYKEGANFISLLNSELVEIYVEWVTQHRENCSPTEIAARVDSHHLLFYLSVIHRVLEAVAKPKRLDSKILSEAWGNLQSRFKHAISLIVEVKLSDDPFTNQIREMIAESQTE
ncbi:hypothetical protein F4225_06335 [Candidatus Poribacteria bacterium]|nr:hypothetical protein [Candidatus Poribacteria bacterium]